MRWFAWDAAAGAAKRLKGSSAAVLLLPELLACPGRSLGRKAAALSCFGGLPANTCMHANTKFYPMQAARFHNTQRQSRCPAQEPQEDLYSGNST